LSIFIGKEAYERLGDLMDIEMFKGELMAGHTPWKEIKEMAQHREFETGATRDTAEGKPEYDGFNSPLVEKRFGEYMHLHRHQSDGSLRSSSNWKKGIPIEEYMHSLHRHFIDLWLHEDGFPEEANDNDIQSILCAIRFNVNGILHETIKNAKKEVGSK
jgi:hypothetical protein